MDIEAIPFNRFLGITRSQQEGRGLWLPADVRYTNHLGTVNAGAQLALAEAASGDYLLREFKDVSFEVVPVVRRLEAKFRRPAYGAIHANVSVTPEKKKEFVSNLTSKGRALAPVKQLVFGDDGGRRTVREERCCYSKNVPCFGSRAWRFASSSPGVGLRCCGGRGTRCATAASRSATIRSQMPCICSSSQFEVSLPSR